MSFADVARSSLKNNKIIKQKMFSSFGKKKNKRVYKAKTKNPHIKNMSKKELKAYRKELQHNASQRMITFWLCFFGLFLSMLIFIAIR
ncbi:MAG: hypothetical protein ACPGVH_08405 [Chitinophagales bacterium]